MIELMDKVVDGVDVYYPLDLAKERFVVRDLDGGGYLILNFNEDNLHLDFAVMGFGYSVDDQIFLSVVFYGHGPMGALRQCRHTYWGDAGYIFYPNGKIIQAGLKALEEFFDMD
jgi:hypothetical protein